MNNTTVGMPCFVCKVALVMSDRQCIEIDYCPQCCGVWLDRGELDKIIERSAQDAPAAARPAANRGPDPHERERDRPRHHGDDDERHRDERHQGKRRGSFFEGLFD